MTAFDVSKLAEARAAHALARAKVDETEDRWAEARLTAELVRINFGDLGSNQETRSRALAEAVDDDRDAQVARKALRAAQRELYAAQATLDVWLDLRRQAEFEQRERMLAAGIEVRCG